ncbi:MAG: LysM peptidoglycan-binding domain-containing protein [Candidatus Azobacteroides sp.]|nr:LysM peptidoglycan-binding domain-containing protein [Candidatus Azobacteroides sp.]
MELKDKYAKLINYASSAGIDNFSVTQQGNVLHISGTATASVKNTLWDMYNQIDPDMRSGDLVMDISVKSGGEQVYEVKPGDNLSKIAQRYPNMTWQKIFEANRDILKNPDLIKAGQKLKIPV